MTMASSEYSTECPSCEGSGFDSISRRTGLESGPVYYRPFGVWTCAICDGTGKVDPLMKLYEVMTEQIKEQIDATILKQMEEALRQTKP